jgi:hypothetical protein
MARRNRGADESDVIGSRGKAAPDNGPLFGAPTEKRTPGPAGKRYSELPPSYDALRADHGTVLGPRGAAPDLSGLHEFARRGMAAQGAVDALGAGRARMPESAALKGETARGSATSEAAARAMDAVVPTLAWLVLQHIISCGAHGATREETTIALGKRLSSVTARIRELYLMGHIGSNPGHTRTNGETGLENEVMLYETHVQRWTDGQARPPVPLSHRRRHDAP